MSQFRPSINTNTRQSSVFVRPLSEPEEIAQNLSKHFPFLNVTASDIAKPTCEVVCDIYHCIAEKVMKIAPATFTVPPLSAVPESGCDSELFSNVIPKIVILSAMSALLEDISDSPGPEFGMNDLIIPDPKATRHFLSVLLDFLEFSEKANKEVEYAFSVHDEKKAELQTLEKEILGKANELEKLRSESNSRKRLANEVREQLDQVLRMSQDLKDEIDKMQGDCKTDDAEIKRIRSEIEDLNEQVSQLNAQMEVSKLEDELQSVKERLSTKRRESAEAHNRKRLNAQNAKAIEVITNKIDDLKRCKEDFAQKEEEINILRDSVKKTQDDLHSLEKLMKLEEDKATSSNLSFQRDCEKHSQELASISEQIQVMEKAADDLRKRMDNVNKENLAVQNEIRDVKREMAGTVRNVEAKMHKLESWLNTVFNQVNEDRDLFEEEQNQFAEAVDLVNVSFDNKISEGHDTFTASVRNESTIVTKQTES
uniref:Nuf2 domain-containing protein n=1 Tax=Syphacia muris TaxID=451379 RepID=A0A0N5AR16_9BILA